MSFRSTDTRPDSPAPSPRLALLNLPFQGVSYLDLIAWLGDLGHQPVTAEMRRGAAIVQYRDVDQAAAALATLRGPGAVLEGRRVRVDFARSAPAPQGDPDATDRPLDPLKLIICGLSFTRSSEDAERAIVALCLRLGLEAPVNVNLPKDHLVATRHRGIAFLGWATAEATTKARERLAGAALDGRTLAVSHAYAKPARRSPVNRMAAPGRVR